jgi:hypothetical protein
MFCGGRGKQGSVVEKGKGPWPKNDVLMIFFKDFFYGGREDEDKQTQDNGQTCRFF